MDSQQTNLFNRSLPLVEAPADYQPPSQFPRIHEAKRIIIDWETYDPELKDKGPGVRRGAYEVGVAVCTDDWKGDYYPIRHQDAPNCDADQVFSWLRDELSRFTGELVGANVVLYDGDFMHHHGIISTRPSFKWRDVQWAEALIDENASSYSLESLAKKYLGIGKETHWLKEHYGEHYIELFQEVHPAHAKQYVMGDIHRARDVYEKQLPILKHENLFDLFKLESSLAPLLLYMRERGVRVDLQKAEIERRNLADKLTAEHKYLRDAVGFDVNVDAPNSLAKAFDQLGLKYPKTLGEHPKPSFQNEWMATHQHPFSQHVVKVRKISKTITTFIDNFIFGYQINGRLHCEFHPLKRMDDEGSRGTVIGRFSSTNPNLQQIPKRDKEIGPMMRSLFIPDEGRDWWSADFSQMQYRLLVHYAYKLNCTGSQQARGMYSNNPKTDFHKYVVDMAKVSRDEAKTLNYGLSFGMGVGLLAKKLGLVDTFGGPTPAAYDLMNKYHDGVPFASEIKEICDKRAAKRGFITTLLNRRHRYPLWEPRKRQAVQVVPLARELAEAQWGKSLRRAGTHKALCHLLQGGEADYAKKTLADIWESGIIGRGTIDLYLIAHDENDGDVERGEAGQKALKQIHEIMEHAVKLEVPMLADMNTGSNWKEAH